MRKQIIRIYCVVLSLMTLSCTTQVSGQNVAKGKSYSYSPSPNYNATKGNDTKDLTDGLKKTGIRFWQDASTVGWGYQNEIQINLDLGGVYTITGFLINTARGSAAEVEFPFNCFVFTSTDNENFNYQGDLMATGDNGPGGYLVKSFIMKKAATGRFIKFVIKTKSKFVFLDEIEVYGNKTNAKYSGIKGIKKSQLPGFIENLNSKAINKIGESSLIDTKIKVQSKDLKPGITIATIPNLNEVRSFNFGSLQAAQKKSLSVQKSISPYGANYFSVVNNSSKNELIRLNFPKGVAVKLYEILPTIRLSGHPVWDALKPIRSEISLNKGDIKVIAAFVEQGNGKSVECTVSATDKIVGQLSLMNNRASTWLKGGGLNINVWAYLDKPVLKENKTFAINDLENASVNTIVVHSAFIDPVGAKDFRNLKSYLSNFKNLAQKKILLFYNLKNNPSAKFRGDKFLDSKWKGNFANWYGNMLKELSRIGVNSSNIYFYPFDEIKANEVDNFIALNKWAKKAVPNFKSFVTIIDEKSFEAGNYADIVQVSMFKIRDAKKIHAPNIWVYDVLDNARSRNPYSDYRLMAWKAFYYNMSGIGFWNYSALPSKNAASYKSAISGNVDYSVLYVDENGLSLSSLRWMYFQLGADDYKILKRAEQKNGRKSVMSLVKTVIDNPNNENLADKVIGQLLGL